MPRIFADVYTQFEQHVDLPPNHMDIHSVNFSRKLFHLHSPRIEEFPTSSGPVFQKKHPNFSSPRRQKKRTSCTIPNAATTLLKFLHQNSSNVNAKALGNSNVKPFDAWKVNGWAIHRWSDRESA